MEELVFISFSSEDSEFVRGPLLESLHNAGVPAWTYFDIPPGGSISEAIGRALDTSSVFLVVLSKNSAGSAWVAAELHAAQLKFLKLGRPEVIPILLDDCTIPVLLRDVAYIDCRTCVKEAITKLIAHLRKVLHLETTTREQLSEHWISKFRDGSETDKQLAMEVLFGLGRCETTTVLLGDVENQDELTRRRIAKRLTYYIQPYLEPHYRRLAVSRDAILAPSALACLVCLGDPNAFRKLMVLRKEDGPEMRRNILRNIPQLELPGEGELLEVAGVVRECLFDPHSSVRETALDTAMKLRSRLRSSGKARQRVVAAARNLLEDPDPAVRRLASTAVTYLSE